MSPRSFRQSARRAFGVGVCGAWLLAGFADVTAQVPPSAQGQPPAGRQGQAGRQGGPPATAQAAAPTDVTGTWVAVITEDWSVRMMTPPKGDVASIPVNPAGREAAKNWDPAKDIAAGEQCKAFGAPGIMRMPTRIRISWQDPQTLKLEFDNGTQTRLFHFDPKAHAPAQPGWQGHSIARWEGMLEAQGQTPQAAGGAAPGPVRGGASGGLHVVTTQLRPGYLRRNGVPYSGNAAYTEFFDVVPGTQGESWLIVTSELADPQYLNMPYMLSTHFKKEADASKFAPRPCELTPPPVAGTARN